MFFFDPVYFLFILPGVLLALWAQWRVSSAFGEASRVRPRSNMTGAQAADEMLRAAGVEGCRIERTDGYLSDHYDPSTKTLRLSPDVFGQRSVAALGIACHEAGHALQDAARYAPLVMRNALVPVASFGSTASWYIIMAGFVLAGMQMYSFGRTVVYIGIGAFALAVLFQLINLPVEFDASARAKRALIDSGMVDGEEARYVSKVLNAAALTYVAGTLTAVLTLLYYLFRAGLLGGNRDD